MQPNINQKVGIDTLRSVLSSLKNGDYRFATDLISRFERFGSLSPGQSPYVATLISRAQGVSKPAVSVSTPINLGGFEKVVALFQLAKTHLKFPKIVLQCNGETIRLSIAGPASGAPGSINVAGEGQYPNRKWFGRVSPEGQWVPTRKIDSALLAALEALLVEFGNDPAGIAKKYGTLTGNCCFCDRKLTDERSTAAGFGPVCADHYGLKDQWAQNAARLAAAA